MKPTSQITIQPKRSDRGEFSFALHPQSRPTDYNFKPTSHELRTAGSASGAHMSLPITPAFRNLSNEFLGAETKRSYAVEAGFFAIIVAVSAWPIASMVHALVQLLK